MTWVISELHRVVIVKGMTIGEKKSEEVISKTSSLLSQDGLALVKQCYDSISSSRCGCCAPSFTDTCLLFLVVTLTDAMRSTDVLVLYVSRDPGRSRVT